MGQTDRRTPDRSITLSVMDADTVTKYSKMLCMAANMKVGWLFQLVVTLALVIIMNQAGKVIVLLLTTS